MNTPEKTTQSDYIHGTDADEQRRLSRLNELLNPGCLAELALAPGDRVLEVGSGLGQFAIAMACEVGDKGHVVAVERDPRQLQGAEANVKRAGHLPLELRLGEAPSLPLIDAELGSFDVAHARFLLEHVQDPLAVVKAMLAAVRPGGRVVIEDDDHELFRLSPAVPGFAELWSQYMRLQDRLGYDPQVGRRLVSLLSEAGAMPKRATYVFFGGCAGEERFADYVTNLVEIVEGVRSRLAHNRLHPAKATDDVLRGLRDWAKRADATIWYAVSWAEGVRRAPSGKTPRRS